MFSCLGCLVDVYPLKYRKNECFCIKKECENPVISFSHSSVTSIYLLTTSINGWIIEEKTVNKNPGDQSSPGVFFVTVDILQFSYSLYNTHFSNNCQLLFKSKLKDLNNQSAFLQ